jgi:hypothetical protein
MAKSFCSHKAFRANFGKACFSLDNDKIQARPEPGRVLL